MTGGGMNKAGFKRKAVASLIDFPLPKVVRFGHLKGSAAATSLI
jgi:hypothetical protein